MTTASESPKTRVVWAPLPRQARLIACPANEIFFGGARGGGKAQSYQSLTQTPKGWIKLGDLRVGDSIIDPTTGGSQKVVGIYPQGPKQFYRVTCDDGASTLVCGDHLWLHRLANHKRPGTKRSEQRVYARDWLETDYPDTSWDHYRVGTTASLIEAMKAGFGIRIPLTAPVLFDVNGRTGKGLVPAYLAGLLLGDGALGAVCVYSFDEEIKEWLTKNGFKAHNTVDKHGERYSFTAVGAYRRAVKQWLANHGLSKCRAWEKFIPPYVFTADLQYRLEFLQGLMDTDGTVDERGRCYFISTSKLLAEGVQELARSLGGKARLRNRQTRFTYLGELKDGRPSYQVRIWLNKSSSLFRLSRKKDRCTDSWNGGHELTREIVSIEKAGVQDAMCIQVSGPRGLYITDDYIVTHNTDGIIGHFFSKANKWGPKAKGLVLRRTLKGLTALEQRCKEIYGQVFSVKDCWHKQEKLWEFPNGATLRMGYLESEDDVYQYQGHAYPFIYPEELTQWEHELNYAWLFTINRDPEVPCQIVSTGNPGGPGMGWVKKRFIDFGPPDRIHTVEIPSPRAGEPPLKRTRIFIPSKLADNPYLQNTGYEAGLLELPERMRLMHLDGRWDVVEGAFFDEWDPKVHVCRAFNPPSDWLRWFGFDWGFDKPYAGVWFCQSPAGKIYIYREIYGIHPDGTENKGCRKPARMVAQEIREIEARAGEHITERWGDTSMWNEDGGVATIGDEFAGEGVFFQKVRKYDKKEGIELLRSKFTVINGVSQLQVMDNCRHFARCIPLLQVDPHNPMVYDTRGEDHIAEAAIYGLRKNLPGKDDFLMLDLNRQRTARLYGSGGWR